MLEHQHLIVRAEVLSPPSLTKVVPWIESLVDRLGMNILYGPFAMRCDLSNNEGITAGCILSTSHLIVHTWDNDNPSMVQLDVYSCSHLDPEIIWEALKDFEPVHVDYKFLDRKEKFIEILEKSS